VQGTAESLCRRPRSQQEIAEHTAIIRRNIDKADRTIQALIDLAKPRRQDPGKVAAHELFGEVADLLRVEAKRRHTTLQVAVPAAGLHLVTDRTLLAQALLNLVLNAIQAGRSDGGKVRMHARAMHLGGRALLALAVDDDGTGPPPELQRSTFPPFFTTKPEGTGLGLSSCRRIADELGGALRLYPRQRGGARALLLLPQDHDSPAVAPNADGRLACASTSC
jgi:signal transduction histidine kinase